MNPDELKENQASHAILGYKNIKSGGQMLHTRNF